LITHESPSPGPVTYAREVNERLLSEPHLASDAPTQEGFLAIIMPRPEDVQKLRKLALSPEEYRALRSVDEQ